MQMKHEYDQNVCFWPTSAGLHANGYYPAFYHNIRQNQLLSNSIRQNHLLLDTIQHFIIIFVGQYPTKSIFVG